MIRALHPTPAVCGQSRDSAFTLLNQIETFERGLYGGLVGVMTQKSLELTVAIRSARVQGRSVCIFTGAGIVSDSDYDEEWQELNQKTRAFLSFFDILKDLPS